ncbi:hypothetical protein QTO34_006071 [Cnephaeus nilssonii]|uniref:Ankyrin-3 n=1 Tax=Cnephaeus nilssonii TaxID=3371016 RepID=A0AA40HLZ2_CNENI|nr:hypothetical protein QTO34_006071 [Eptesicus nilssonii]
MTAILQTDVPEEKPFQPELPREGRVEDEEPFKIVEKVKEDLVKVSEILKKDVCVDNKGPPKSPQSDKGHSPEDDWIEFSSEEIREARQQAAAGRSPTLPERVQGRAKAASEKDYSLTKVIDYLTNDIGSSSLTNLKYKFEDAKKDDAILESPDDFSQHDQDKSPLSDSGFETRSEKTPSAPQSAESTGPKPLFHEVPIPPVITETRTEVVHVIRSYEPSAGEASQSQPEEPASPKPSPTFMELEPKPSTSSIKEKVKAFQMKASSDEDDHNRALSKGMRVKEETHITTTTRTVYHSPPGSEGASERIEETMSVHDIMKAFQSGRDPSKELAGLFEHKSAVAPDVHKSAADTSAQHAEKDNQMKPKLERIIEVHIEKGNQAEPTEVIIRETKKHPEKEMYVYQKDLSRGDVNLKDFLPEKHDAFPGSEEQGQQEEEELTAEESLPSYLESSRVNTPVSQEEDSRPSSAQLISDDSYKTLKLLSQHSIEYHDDELSELRGESYRFAEKMLLSEKLDVSHSDTEESVTDHAGPSSSELQGSDKRSREKVVTAPKKEILSKIYKDVSENGVGKVSKDEHFDKVTVLHYSGDGSSPKHAMWMRFTEDRLDRGREKLMYEDRVDRTVKEAEEKLTEVSQFFRDKTEKLNDELQSPEKKARPRNGKEYSSQSSTSSSPEKVLLTELLASSDEWVKARQHAHDGQGLPRASERKASSLPSSPEKKVLSQQTEDSRSTEEAQGSVPQSKAPEGPQSGFQLKQSKLSSIRLKFEQGAQTQKEKQQKAIDLSDERVPAQKDFMILKAKDEPEQSSEMVVNGSGSDDVKKQRTEMSSSPEDDTLEQVSFLDSSGKSPLTPETPSSEEVSYEFTSKTPDSLIAYIPGKPSPIPEVSEESEEEEQGKSSSLKQTTVEEIIGAHEMPSSVSKDSNQRPKTNRVAYIEFPPPPPLDADQIESEKHLYLPEREAGMIEVSLQDEHDKYQLAEPVIRVQPPSPVPPGADVSDSSDDESLYQPVPVKKYTFKLKEQTVIKKKQTKPKASAEKASNQKELETNGSGKDHEFGLDSPQNETAQNGNNDQSITECSIATTAEFSHEQMPQRLTLLMATTCKMKMMA